MPQKLALLICAKPRLGSKGPSVYVPYGSWKIDFSEVVNSEYYLESQSIHAEDDENWERIFIRDGIISEEDSAKCFRAVCEKAGLEESITLTILKCH